MTNEQIIFNNRVFLMEQGVIKGIEGTTVKVVDENGEREVMMPEEIHTFNEWKRRGYQVQKGEHAVAKFPIWKFEPNKKAKEKPEEEMKEDEMPLNGRCFMKVAFFFVKSQV